MRALLFSAHRRWLCALQVAVFVCAGHLRAASPERAMWVYKTAPILASSAEQGELFAFCEARHITDLFWQMHFVSVPEREVFTIAEDAALHRFLKEASAHHLRVHALSGDPVHVLTKNHARVLARVDALLAFNQASPADEQFAGVHFDIEPHALPEWKQSTTEEKTALLTQLVEVNAKIADKLRAEHASLLLGADIVFWLDKVKPDGSAVYPVTFRGVTKDAAKHLLDLVDNVGIMSYRNTATGRNGINTLVERTITYADTARGKAFVGVKMANIGPATESFYGRTEPEMMKALLPVEEAFALHRGYAGLAFFMYEAFRAMPR